MRFSVPDSHAFPWKHVFGQWKRIKPPEIGGRTPTIICTLHRCSHHNGGERDLTIQWQRGRFVCAMARPVKDLGATIE